MIARTLIHCFPIRYVPDFPFSYTMWMNDLNAMTMLLANLSTRWEKEREREREIHAIHVIQYTFVHCFEHWLLLFDCSFVNGRYNSFTYTWYIVFQIDLSLLGVYIYTHEFANKLGVFVGNELNKIISQQLVLTL